MRSLISIGWLENEPLVGVSLVKTRLATYKSVSASVCRQHRRNSPWQLAYVNAGARSLVTIAMKFRHHRRRHEIFSPSSVSDYDLRHITLRPTSAVVHRTYYRTHQQSWLSGLWPTAHVTLPNPGICPTLHNKFMRCFATSACRIHTFISKSARAWSLNGNGSGCRA